MAIAFTTIPQSNRVPGAYGELDPSRAAGVEPEAHHALLIGFRLAAGPTPAGVLKPIAGETEADGHWGATSQIANMVRAYKRLNTAARVSAIAVDEDAGGVAATGTLTVAGTATAPGTLTVRFGDVRVSVAVAAEQAAAAIATALATAAGTVERNPFTAAAAAAVVTATARHRGTAYNGVTLAAESLPAGITVAVVQPAGGATDPSLAALIAGLDEERFDSIVTGIAGAANLALLEGELDRRWGPTVKQPGHLFAAIAGDHAALTTFGTARNSRYSTVMGSGASPTPPWIWAAQTAARDGQRCDSITPNRPRKGLTLPDCEAPARGASTRFDWSERNILLRSGISTYTVDRSGMVAIDRLITTYQTSAAGLPDVSYLAIETVRNLGGILLRWLALAAKYQDAMLGQDGDDYSPGVPVLTPRAWKGEVDADYADLIRAGRCKDAEAFRASMIAEINTLTTDRLDFSAEPRLVQGLVTLAFKIAFRL